MIFSTFKVIKEMLRISNYNICILIILINVIDKIYASNPVNEQYLSWIYSNDCIQFDINIKIAKINKFYIKQYNGQNRLFSKVDVDENSEILFIPKNRIMYNVCIIIK